MNVSGNRHWQVPAHAQLAWYRWNDEFVFHHAISNDTHRLAQTPGELIVHIAAHGAQSTADLARHFQADVSDMASLLAQLAELDFVACIS